MKVDQDWWKAWFKRLEKDGHIKLLKMYEALRQHNPKEFHTMMDELWKLNFGTVVNYNKKDHNAFVKTQLDLFAFEEKQLSEEIKNSTQELLQERKKYLDELY